MSAPFFSWTPNLSVGVDVLDDDHKRLMHLINDLHDGIAAGQGTERLESVLDGLVKYTAIHFAREEELFSRSSYPSAAEHVKAHEGFTNKTLDIQARYNKGEFDALSLDTMDFLKNWLTGHIQGTDHQYEEYLHSIGVH